MKREVIHIYRELLLLQQECQTKGLVTSHHLLYVMLCTGLQKRKSRVFCQAVSHPSCDTAWIPSHNVLRVSRAQRRQITSTSINRQCLWVQSLQLCSTLCDPMDCSPSGSSVHGNVQARILGYHSLLQGIFPTQGSNSGLLHCRQTLYRMSQQSSPAISIFIQLFPTPGLTIL